MRCSMATSRRRHDHRARRRAPHPCAARAAVQIAAPPPAHAPAPPRILTLCRGEARFRARAGTFRINGGDAPAIGSAPSRSVSGEPHIADDGGAQRQFRNRNLRPIFVETPLRGPVQATARGRGNASAPADSITLQSECGRCWGRAGISGDRHVGKPADAGAARGYAHGDAWQSRRGMGTLVGCSAELGERARHKHLQRRHADMVQPRPQSRTARAPRTG